MKIFIFEKKIKTQKNSKTKSKNPKSKISNPKKFRRQNPKIENFKIQKSFFSFFFKIFKIIFCHDEKIFFAQILFYELECISTVDLAHSGGDSGKITTLTRGSMWLDPPRYWQYQLKSGHFGSIPWRPNVALREVETAPIPLKI